MHSARRRDQLTVVRHLLAGHPSIEDEVVVPLPVSVLSAVLPHEVGCKIRWRAMQNMKMCKEEKCNGSDRTELNMAVADGPMFVHATMLVVFGIVSKDGKDLSSV